MPVDMDLAAAAPTEEAPEAAPAAGEELRLALAMRGGLSLAVWIGGAVAEIEWLRRSGSGDGHGVEGGQAHSALGHPAYRALLELSGYAGVLVDVLTGASAGGLNGAVYAAAQRHGFDVAEMRDLWLRLGDIEALTRATTSAGRAATSVRRDDDERRLEALRPPSLLDGDGYFYPRLLETIEGLITRRNGAGVPVADRVDLLLSATLFTPARVRVRLNRLTTIVETGASALFRFRRGPGHDTLADGEVPGSAARRLAMAARSTSSFPVLFEPARIHVGTGVDPDFRGVFEAPGDAPVGEWRVVDGGVLDNIPVAAAIGAIVDAPADGPTERWLLYLHPSPPVEPEREAGPPAPVSPMGSPRAFRTALRAAGTTAGQESLLADIGELEAANDRARRRRLATAEVFAGFHPTSGDIVGQLQEACRRTADVAAEIRIKLDVEAVLAVLRRPPSADAVAAGITTALPLARWSAEDELALPKALHQAMGERPDDDPWRSPTVLRDLVRLLITWARTLERLAAGQPASPASVAKARAYRLGTLVAALAGRHRQAWLAAAAARTPKQAAAASLVAWAGETWRALPRRVPAEVAGALELVLNDDISAAALVQRIPSLLGGHGSEFDEAIWRAGQSLARDLHVAAIAQPTRPEEVDAPFHLLEAVPPGDLETAVASVLSLAASVDLLGPPSGEIRLAQITGGASTPLDQRFEKLKEDRQREEGLDPAQRLRPSDKLCGDELGNCAAFLSAKWRANDWTWGRLDAASTLVSLLLDPERLSARRRALGREEFARLARAAMTAELPDGWNFDDRWAGVADAIAAAEDHPDPAAWTAAVTALCNGASERIQWEIVASELPVVAGVGHEPPSQVPRVEPRPFDDVVAEVRAYDVGRQQVRHLGDARRLRICLRLALVAFGVLRPDGKGATAVAGRCAVSAFKPLYLALVMVAASPRRGLFVAAAALASLQATYWRSPGARLGSLPDLWWVLVAVAAVTLLAHPLLRRWPSQRASEVASAVLIIGWAALGGALVAWLWPSGARWTVLSVLALALATTALWRWSCQRRRLGAPAPAAGWLWYPATAAAAAAGVAASLVDWEILSDDFADRFLLLTAVALIVTWAATGWMRTGHRCFVLALTLGVYAATAGPFRDRPPPWVVVVVGSGAALTAGVLGLLVASDGWRRRRIGHANSPVRAVTSGVAVLATAGIAAWAATRHVSWSESAWLLLAVPGSTAAFTVAVTFADVLQRAPRWSVPSSTERE
jgi:patatin-related protein